MAIDSRNKRAAAVGFGLVSRLIAPNPDGSIAALPDREQIVWLYSGFATTGGGGGAVLLIRRRRR